MNKQLSLLLALGCASTFASPSTNYDLLGRRGSKMHSPMVYKNIDYSKIGKKNQELNLENRVLHKTGMPNNVAAFEGAYQSYVDNKHFSIKTYSYTNSDDCSNLRCRRDWNDYKNISNSIFIELKDENASSYTVEKKFTNLVDNSPYSFSLKSLQTHNNVKPSPFATGKYITYGKFYDLHQYSSHAYSVENWYRNKATKVGLYMGADALPVRASYAGTNPVEYIQYNGKESFNPVPAYETRDSKVYNMIKVSSQHIDVFVGKEIEYGNPALSKPQIYMGVRNDRMAKGSNSTYSAAAKKLDNFIYKYRTAEFIPAGNYGDDANKSGYVSAKGQAANAITVGAVDAVGETVSSYTSTKNYDRGSTKPEIYNYSNFLDESQKRIYTLKASGRTFEYEPDYEGTEIAAAYTAGMASFLLAINPFYRWHPEVLKALLLTSSGIAITPPYPTNAVMESLPSYTYLVFDDVGQKNFFNYDSRYWNGNMDKLKTRTNANGQKEIWFVTKNLGSSSKAASAAISWLSSGNDISNIGYIPQDFDMIVYGSNNSIYDKYVKSHEKLSGINFDNPGDYIAASNWSFNSFEKVSIASNHKYLIFCITLYSEDERSENKGEVVLGFNLASYDFGDY